MGPDLDGRPEQAALCSIAKERPLNRGRGGHIQRDAGIT